MHSPIIAADILAGVIAVAGPLTGPFERGIYQSDPDSRLKLLTYGVTIALSWTLMAAAVWIDGWDRLFASPAAGRPWLWAPAILSLGLGVAVGAYITVALLPLIQSLRGPRWRRAYAAAYRRGFTDIVGLLPNTAIERAAWVLLSLTAGICEEVLFRGFLIRFFHEGGFGMPMAAALVASACIFGLGHVYQGVKGVVGTAIGGLVFGLLFLLSGSLLACIALHVLVDVQTAYVLGPVAEDDIVRRDAA